MFKLFIIRGARSVVSVIVATEKRMSMGGSGFEDILLADKEGWGLVLPMTSVYNVS